MKHFIRKHTLLMAFPYSIMMFLSSCLGINSDVKSKPTGEQTPTTPPTSMYDIKLTTIDGKPFDLHSLEGKKILIVNTASKCGYTPQYAELQELHVKYGDSLAILGFPCNDFGGQEAGTESEIGAFCQKNYGVTFQLFQKVSIKGENQHPLYKWLTTPALNGWNKDAPGWNFCKYLISEKGELLNFFGSGVKPMGKEMSDALAK